MPVAYPLGLSTIIRASKVKRQPASFSMAEPRRGPAYTQDSGTDTPIFFDALWRFTRAEAQTFETWFTSSLNKGKLEFTMPSRQPGGLLELTFKFLPDALLDSREVGELWEYSATIMTRSLSGPVIVPAPPPPPPAPAPSPSGWFYSAHVGAVVFTAGEGGALVQTELESACAESVARDVPLMLPPWGVQFNRTIFVNKMIGVPGKSRLVPSGTFTRTGFANQFMIINSNFEQGFIDATANEVLYSGWDLVLTPSASGSVLGLGNVRSGLIERVNISVLRAINGATGKPYAIDSTIDLYSCVKNVMVRRCTLKNITGAYGVTKISEFGGACFWIRNLSANGTLPANVTENNVVEDCVLEHSSSDEAFAIYGVRGVTRSNRVRNNRVLAYSIDGVYRTTLFSCFPLDDGSGPGLGDTAAVYDNEISGNEVTDSGTLYTQLRIGNGPDANRPCYNNRSFGNRITAIRSSNPATGQRAVWLALGSPGPDPELASSVYRCIDGNFGAAYFRDTSGNSSTDDVAINNGATANTGFQSFQQVTNPTSLGDLFSGVSNCRFVFGGKIECAAYPFFNCRSVVGTNYRQNLPGGSVFFVDLGLAGVFGFKDTVGESFGRLVQMTGAAPAGTVISVYNNDCVMNSASSYPILENGSSSGAMIIARQNITRGASSAVTAGAGAANIQRSLNYWNTSTPD